MVAVTDQAQKLIDEVAGEHAAEMDNKEVKTKTAEKDVMAAERDLNQRDDSGIEYFPFAQLYRRDNVRTPQTLHLDAMVKSLKEKGFKKQYPLVVSLKSNGRGLVLCGNRRHEGLEIIFKEDPALLAAILGSEDLLVPCVIHKGLTEEEEIVLRIDHSEAEDRVPLDQWGEVLAVKQLVRAGYDTQAGIAKKLGQFDRKGEPNRSWAQVRVNLVRLPAFIQEEFRKLLTDGKTATKVRMNMIPELFEIWNEEFALGYATKTGPKLAARWQEIMNPPEDDLEGGQTASTPRAATAGQLQEVAKRFDSRIVRKSALRAAGMPTTVDDSGKPKMEEWSEIVAEALQAEAAEEALARISVWMGANEFANMMREIDAQLREGKQVKMTKTFARSMNMFLEDYLNRPEVEPTAAEQAMKEQVLDKTPEEAQQLGAEVGAAVMAKDDAEIPESPEVNAVAGDNEAKDVARDQEANSPETEGGNRRGGRGGNRRGNRNG